MDKIETQKPLQSFTGGLREVRWSMRVIISALDRFYWDNGFSKAASLAYTTLLSLFPALGLVFGLFAAIVPKETLDQIRSSIFHQFVPSGAVVEAVMAQFSTFSEVISRAPVNQLVLVSLLVTSILLINSIEYALNEIWQVFEVRRITDRLAIFSAIILVAPVILLSGIYFTRVRLEGWIDGMGSTVGWLYTILLPVLIDFIAFAALYFLVPKAPVKPGSALFGAAVAAVLFWLAKSGFAYYIERFSSYYILYQTIATIPIFLVWLYFAWIVVLLGAEVSYQAQYLPHSGRIWKRSVLSIGDAKMLLAFQSLAIVTRAFDSGKHMPNELEIAEALGCSSVVLRPILADLERTGILTRGNSRDMPITLMRSPETISLLEIRSALFQDRTALCFAAEVSRLFASISKDSQLADITLKQVVQAEPTKVE